MAQIKIEISADTGIAVLSFLREFVKPDGGHEPQLQFISECVQEFEVAVVNAISPEVFEDVMENIRIQALIGNSPPNAGLIIYIKPAVYVKPAIQKRATPPKECPSYN